MTRTPRPAVLFRVAAGPRIGFGHLVRAVSLAKALKVEARLSIRGGRQAVAVARRMGATVVAGGTARSVLAGGAPALLVLDDRVASRTGSWRRAARRLGIPIAGVHDLGIGLGDADLVIDGSLRPTVRAGARSLLGPRYAILRPGLVRRRLHALAARRARGGSSPRVLVSLGGGPRRGLAVRVARLVAARHPEATVGVAAGFVKSAGREASSGIQWIPSDRFDEALAQADVAVIGGGVTLLEACCLGVPCVAVAVAASQRPSVEEAAARGAVLDGGLLDGPRACAVAADAAAGLLRDSPRRLRLALRAARLVDGRGAARVAAALGRLARGRRR
jgi:spore coat polysaccharide biosynthesis predicted glycosyltransferase SpsG